MNILVSILKHIMMSIKPSDANLLRSHSGESMIANLTHFKSRCRTLSFTSILRPPTRPHFSLYHKRYQHILLPVWSFPLEALAAIHPITIQIYIFSLWLQFFNLHSRWLGIKSNFFCRTFFAFVLRSFNRLEASHQTRSVYRGLITRYDIIQVSQAGYKIVTRRRFINHIWINIPLISINRCITIINNDCTKL